MKKLTIVTNKISAKTIQKLYNLGYEVVVVVKG